MTSRIKPAGNEDAPRKTQGGISSTPVFKISNSAPSQKQFLSAESREVMVSPAIPFRSVFHPNQTKILFIYHSNQSLIILGFTPYAEAEI